MIVDEEAKFVKLPLSRCISVLGAMLSSSSLAAEISRLETTNLAFELPGVAREKAGLKLGEGMLEALSPEIPVDYHEKQNQQLC